MSPKFLIKDVRIFDGENDISSGSVLVENGLIKQVAEGSLTVADASTIVISKPGHTLIPGLIDGHVHVYMDEENSALKQSLKFGLTTICDMHQEAKNVSKLRELAEEPDAADYKTSSQSATISGGWPEPIIATHHHPDEVRAMTSSWPDIQSNDDVDAFIANRLKDKADYVKLMHEDGHALSLKVKKMPVELQKVIVESAHRNGLLTVAHALSLHGTMEMLQAGVDGMAHTFCDRSPTQEVTDAYLATNAFCCPTLAVIASLTGEGLGEQKRSCQDPRAQKYLNDQDVESLHRCIGLGSSEAKVEHAYESVRQLKATGVDIILGTDSARSAHGTAFGLSAHQELGLLVKECGFTPKEALRAGTAVVAKRLRFNDRGRIVEGLRADLVLVEGNPLEDIDQTLNLRGVWKKGTLCSTYNGIAT